MVVVWSMPVIVPGIKMTRSWWRVYGALKGAGGGDGGLNGSHEFFKNG